MKGSGYARSSGRVMPTRSVPGTVSSDSGELRAALFSLSNLCFTKNLTIALLESIKGLAVSGEALEKIGGRTGTRTPDPLIKR